MSFEILEKLLVNYPSSPLKIAFNDAKIGKEIEGHYETDLYYYTLMLIGRDMKDNADKKVFFSA
jgi:Zn-dependent M16 (insulinase) family peptidase